MGEGLFTPSHKDTSAGRLLCTAIIQSEVETLVRVVSILHQLLLHIPTVEVVQEGRDQNNRNTKRTKVSKHDPVDKPKSEKQRSG